MFSLCLKGQHIVQTVQLLVFKETRNKVVGDSRGMALTVKDSIAIVNRYRRSVLAIKSVGLSQASEGAVTVTLIVGMIVVCFDVGGGEHGCSSLEEIPSQ